MIELCSKKKMLLAIASLLIISVIVLVVENNVSLGHEIKDSTNLPANLSQDCWETGDSSIEEECSPCTKFEQKAHDFCHATGYRELVKCTLSDGSKKDVYRSCPKISWMEERNFWIFETLTAMVGAVAYANVYYRQKRLDRLLMEKVHKQIAAGV